jgi:hypothetical protein
MKKFTIPAVVLLAILALLAGFFFWKGGHHALYVSWVLDDWLDLDSASHSVNVKVNDTGISGEVFWLEWSDERVLGLQTMDMGLYLTDDVLYMDTGAAYALPRDSRNDNLAGRLALAALLHGRITRADGVYHFTMDTPELKLDAHLTADRLPQTLKLRGSLPEYTLDFEADMTYRPDKAHIIPQTVADAMVCAAMAKPMELTQPLNTAMTAMNQLFPLSSELTLGLECGILNLHETVGFYMNENQAILDRDGVQITMELPRIMSEFPAEALSLFLLRHGAYSVQDGTASFTVTLPADATADFVARMIPQAANLGIQFRESEALLTIQYGKLTRAVIQANGTIPFLVTELDLAFTADFAIS